MYPRPEMRCSTEGADAPGMQGARRDQPLAGCDRRGALPPVRASEPGAVVQWTTAFGKHGRQPGMERPSNAIVFPDWGT